MKLIKDWYWKDLQCVECFTKKSVKYESNGET